MTDTGVQRAGSRELRELFLLDPETVYLNHGSFGACPRPVFEGYQRWQRELELQPTLFFGRAGELLDEARVSLGKYVGAPPQDMVFVTNITVAINVIARSLHLQPGDEVLSTDLEYGAMDYTWEYACELRGAHYVRQHVPLPATSVEDIVEAIGAGVNERTRVLFVSHYTSGTALRLPVEQLVARARAAGILTVIDGAHIPGQVDLDLTALGADFYGANCHKWLMAPKGSAFLYARPEVQELLEPLVVSWGRVRRRSGESRFTAEQEHLGTRDLAAFLTVPEAIAFQRDNGWDQVRDECHTLLCDARRRVSALTEIEPLCPESSAWFAQLGLLSLPPVDALRLKGLLADQYHIEIPCFDGDYPGVRLSVQGYNSAEDTNRLVDALTALLPLVKRQV